MASTRNPLQDFVLTPQQQNLLFAALNSQKTANGQSNQASSINGSPATAADGVSAYQESPYLDYDYDFGGADSSFDFSFDDGMNAKMIGDLPEAPTAPKSESADNDSPDKRSHPDDEDEEEDSGGGKRRESEDKVAKKPGRKPLTTEPSSKRKAQNRAAQRAFRERKEKHLKDLEAKVEELEKISESANHENKLLRAKVDKMTVELSEYKKRVSLMANNRSSLGPARPFGQSFLNNINDVNFQFEFPKFGALPGPPTGKGFTTSQSNAKLPPTRSNSNQLSPTERPMDTVSPSNSSSYSKIGLDSQSKGDIAKMSAHLFNPPLTNGNLANATSRISVDSHYSASGPTSTSSPSASSNSNGGGPSSSCGTSPEPFTQSPVGFKPVDTLTTIGEEHSGTQSSQDLGQFGNAGAGGFSWLPQNDFQFDPNLFGDYREPQENVLSTGIDDSFFNDALDMDFTTPYNLPLIGAKKTNICDQIDAAKEADDVTSSGSLLTCSKIWDKLQNCPKVQNGDFDLDGLCSDLQKKAKCSGSGAVVDEKDFKSVMEKYLGKCEKEIAAEAQAAAQV